MDTNIQGQPQGTPATFLGQPGHVGPIPAQQQQYMYAAYHKPQCVNLAPTEQDLLEINELIEQSFSPDNQIQQMVYQKLQTLEMQNVD